LQPGECQESKLPAVSAPPPLGTQTGFEARKLARDAFDRYLTALAERQFMDAATALEGLDRTLSESGSE
jgi:hypothetical protein